MRSIAIPSLVLLAACEGAIVAPTSPDMQPPPDMLPTQPPPRVVCDDQTHAAKSAMRRLTIDEYQRSIANLFDGRVAPSTNFPGGTGYKTSRTGYSTEPDMNPVSEQGAEQLMTAAEDVAEALAAKLAMVLPCTTTTHDEACARTFIVKYGRRAFRRPVDTADTDLLLTAFRDGLASGASFTESVSMMASMMLQTPQFLYVWEGSGDTLRALDGYERASRLSFMLWDAPPDDALLDLARDGALATPQGLAAQAQRLLLDPRADTAIARLYREWTETRVVTPSDKSQTAFPFFDVPYSQSMAQSFDRFVVDQLRNQGTLGSLLRTNDVWVDSTMADFFQVAAPAAGTWKKVSLDATRYSGLATQPELLASHAHSSESSYVFRGKAVYKRMLCQSLGDPPGNAMAEASAIVLPPDPTAKDVSASIRARSAVCSSCHTMIDPPGLALEQFDALGRHRDQYASGKVIDPSGTASFAGKKVTFTTPVELFSQVADQPELSDCFARQIFRFTMSRPEEPEDACALQAIRDALDQNGGQMLPALLAMTQSEAFAYRKDP